MTNSGHSALFAKFRAVGFERLGKLNQGVVALEHQPDDKSVAETVMREIHTIKGEAKLLGLAVTNAVAHRVEELLIHAREHAFCVSADEYDLVLQGLDLLGDLIEVAPGGPDGEKAIDASVFFSKAGMPAAAALAGQALASIQPQPQVNAVAAETQRTDFVHIGVDKLDRLTELVAEVEVGHATWVDRIGDLDAIARRGRTSSRELRAIIMELRDQEGSAQVWREAVIARLEKVLAQEDALDVDLSRSLAAARDDSYDLRLKIDDLQGRVRDLRLVSISTLLTRYARAVRDLGREQGKQVRADIHEASVEVDKQVVDQLEDVLLHLVRNAVDHGIEPPSARLRAGKPEVGTIILSAAQSGSSVVLTISDDGSGIDPAAVRRVAVERGLVSEAEAAALTEQEVREFIFRHGFTTRAEATDVSGRGVGLDIVRQRATALGGRVGVDSKIGRGTTFRVRVPITVALMPTMIVRVGKTRLALPAEAIVAVPDLAHIPAVQAGGGEALETKEYGLVPLFDLGELLGIGAARAADGSPGVIVAHDGRRAGLRVSRIEGERRIVQRPLDRFGADLRVLSGTAVLEHGELALVLNVARLLESTGEGTSSALRTAAAEVQAHGRLVLVIDDSEITRDMLLTLLKSRGHRVVEAINGREGLARIEERTPDLVITDLEMPVLDGFGFIRELRATPGGQHIPILVLTTRGAEDHKRKAAELGANAYVVKGEFKPEELTRQIDRLLAGAPE